MTEKHKHNVTLVTQQERKIQQPKIKIIDKKTYHRGIHALEQRNVLGMILKFLNPFDQCRIHNCNSFYKRMINDLLPIVYKVPNIKIRDVGLLTCIICHVVGLKMGYPLGSTFRSSMSHYATDLKRRINLCNNCVSYRECDQCDRVFYDAKQLSYIAVDEIDDIEESRCTVCCGGKSWLDD